MVWDMMVGNGMGYDGRKWYGMVGNGMEWQEMVWDGREGKGWQRIVCDSDKSQFSKNLSY